MKLSIKLFLLFLLIGVAQGTLSASDRKKKETKPKSTKKNDKVNKRFEIDVSCLYCKIDI